MYVLPSRVTTIFLTRRLIMAYWMSNPGHGWLVLNEEPCRKFVLLSRTRIMYGWKVIDMGDRQGIADIIIWFHMIHENSWEIRKNCSIFQNDSFTAFSPEYFGLAQLTDFPVVNDALLTWMEALLNDQKARGPANGSLHYYKQKLKLFWDCYQAHAVTRRCQRTARFFRQYLIFS